VFDRDQLNALLDLGVRGCERLTTLQREALGLPTLDAAGLLAVFKK
jgi:ribonuclease PH